MYKIFTLLFTVFLFGNSFGQARTEYPTLKYDIIKTLNISLPYVKTYGSRNQLLVFGSNHTNNFSDPQIQQIFDSIISFKPTIILYEGDGISTEKSLKETVETYFEMGFTKYLADSLKIETLNIEPDTRGKYQFLMTKYKTDDILLATLGLQITMMQIENINFERQLPIMIADLVKEGLPLNKKQRTTQYFYRLYKKNFGKNFNYKNFDSRDIQSKYNRTKFNKINQLANEFRDQHVIKLTKQLIDKKERVFLIVGGWHAIVCQPAFKIITE